MTQGTLTLEDLPALKRLYKKAVENGETMFRYKGIELLTSYAKHLIERMEELKP